MIMTLATNADQLPTHILALTAAPTLRRTIMKQCKLAGHNELEITEALSQLIDEGRIEHARPIRGDRTEPIRYKHRQSVLPCSTPVHVRTA